MNTATRVFAATATFALLMGSNAIFAETITATCYGPTGTRVEIIDGKKEDSKDGYSNSDPTFFFSTKDPDFLIESWQSALPFPDLMSRERADEIAPPSAIKAAVVYRSESVIHAISQQGREAYTTTLYLTENFAIFTRVRIADGGLISGPMGAMYSAKCHFNVLE